MEITSGIWDGENSIYQGYEYDVTEETQGQVEDVYFLFYSKNKKEDGSPSLCGKFSPSVKQYNTGAKIDDKLITNSFVNALVDKMFLYVKGETKFEEIFNDLGSLPDKFFTEKTLNLGARNLRIKMRENNATYDQATYDRADEAIKQYASYISEVHNFTFPKEEPLNLDDLQLLSTSSHLHKNDPYISF